MQHGRESDDELPRALHLVALLGALLSSFGCVTLPDVPTTHIVMVNGRGNPVDPTGNIGCRDKPLTCREAGEVSKHTWILPLPYPQMERGFAARPSSTPSPSSMGVPTASTASYEDYLSRLFEDLVKHAPTKNNKRQILIFIHGGLNTQVGTVGRARELMEFIPRTDYYPIFINWQSSLFSSYGDHLLNVRQGESWDNFGWLLTPFYFTADVTRAMARAPVVWYFMVQNWVKSAWNSDKIKEAEAIAGELEREYHATPAGNVVKMAHDPKDSRGIGTDILAHTTTALTGPTKIVASMFIDAFGKSAWEIMLRRTHMLYHTEREFEESAKVAVEEGKPERPTSHINSDGALSVFLRRLQQVLDRNGGVDAWEITVVGHSMGTIVLNQMIREFGVTTATESQAARVALPFNHIVYMAAAATVRDYQDSVIPYLHHNRSARVYHLILHPKAEIRERFDPGIPYLDLPPRGSLLVWVDEFLSAPETPLDRTVGRYENLLPAVHNTPDDMLGRIHIKAFGAGPEAKGPQKHGDFTAYLNFWKPECWWSPGTDYPAGCYSQ